MGVTALITVGVLLTGCGGDDQPSACGDVTAAIAEGGRALREIAEDPAAAQQAFEKLADDLRTAADSAGPVVKAAADALADRYEALAAGIESGDIPDMDQITDATTAVASACQG
jgi:hypothetical protein